MTSAQEQQLVAAIIEDQDVATPRRIGVEPMWLVDIPSRQALEAIYEYADRPSSMGQVPGRAYLQEFLGFVPPRDLSVGNLRTLCDAARINQLRLRVVVRAQAILAAATENPLEALTRLHEAAADPEVNSLVGESRVTQLADTYSEVLRQYDQSVGSGGMVGVPLPWSALNHATKGIQRGQFWVMYAPEKSMKSFLALAIVASLYRENRRVLVVTSEMTEHELSVRLVGMLQGLNFNDFLDGTLPSDVVADMRDDVAAFEARRGMDIHFFTPSGVGPRAVEEVKAKVIDLNRDGELELVVWDGHYRSAGSDNWEDVYHLVRRTRAAPLDEATGRVPWLVVTQEGSQKGKVSYKAYSQEASVMLRANKLPQDQVELAIVRIRQGRPVKVTIHADFRNCSFEQVATVGGGGMEVGV